MSLFLYYSYVPLTVSSFFFFNDTATTEIYTLSLHDALPIFRPPVAAMLKRHRTCCGVARGRSGLMLSWLMNGPLFDVGRSEEHTSELQSLRHLVCRLLLEKKKNIARCRFFNA